MLLRWANAAPATNTNRILKDRPATTKNRDVSRACLALDDAGGLLLMPTLRLCEGLEFEIRLPSGNEATKRDYRIIEMFFRKSPAPNQS